MALSKRERAEFARFGHYRKLKRGETLFAAGDANRYCCNLIEGILKVCKFDRDGTEHVLSLIRPAGFVGDLFVSVSRHDIVALTDCTLCVVPREQFELAMLRCPEFGCGLFKRSSQDLMDSRALLAAVTSPSAMRRVSRFLLTVTRDADVDPYCEYDLLLTRTEIASMLGLTIGSVSRQLTKLEREGVISRKGMRKVQLANPKRLREIASGGNERLSSLP